MNTKLIEYVITIAEEKSLSKAAQRLYLSQPALSQRLRKLEEELGTPLFQRDKDGLSITDAGRVYINGGRSILRIKEEAYDQLNTLNRNHGDILRFGCATVQGLESVSLFRKHFPDTELITQNCTTPAAIDALHTGRMDLALLLTASLQHDTLEFLPLTKSELYLAVPANHPVLSDPNLFRNGYHALKDDYFILSPSPSFARDMEIQALHLMGLRPRILCEIRDNVSRRYMLNRQMGISFIPKYSVQPSDTFRIFSISPQFEFYIAAAYLKSKTLSEPMKELIRIWLTLFDGRKLLRDPKF